MDIETDQDKKYYLVLCLTSEKDGVDIVGKGTGIVVPVRTEIKEKLNMADIQAMLEQMINEIEIKKSQQIKPQ